jgi:hypothetical protein
VDRSRGPAAVERSSSCTDRVAPATGLRSVRCERLEPLGRRRATRTMAASWRISEGRLARSRPGRRRDGGRPWRHLWTIVLLRDGRVRPGSARWVRRASPSRRHRRFLSLQCAPQSE